MDNGKILLELRWDDIALFRDQNTAEQVVAIVRYGP